LKKPVYSTLPLKKLGNCWESGIKEVKRFLAVNHLQNRIYFVTYL